MSDLRVNTISASDGTSPVTLTKQDAAKVHTLVNQTGTQSVLGSFGVSSIADTGTGDTQIFYSNAFANSNYTFVNGLQRNGTSEFVNSGFDNTTSYIKIEFFSGGGTSDCNKIATTIHGDLA